MSKKFEEIFAETHRASKADAEGYVTMELETKTDAQALAVYVVMNEGALRERDRLLTALREVDANWATYAIEEINKIPRDLPRDE